MNFREEDHKNPQDSQVFIALTGSSEAIEKELIRIIDDIRRYGKPMQGIYVSTNCTKEVITPIWNKRTY